VLREKAPPRLSAHVREYELCRCNEQVLKVSIVEGRAFKDGSHEYAIYLTVPSAKGRITLARVRGSWAYAETRANDILGLKTAND